MITQAIVEQMNRDLRAMLYRETGKPPPDFTLSVMVETDRVGAKVGVIFPGQHPAEDYGFSHETTTYQLMSEYGRLQLAAKMARDILEYRPQLA